MPDKRDIVLAELHARHTSADAILNALHQGGWKIVPKADPADAYQLCMIEDDCWAWFANVPPAAVTGDDWDDAPHDCNAGLPYARAGQEFVKVAWDSDAYMMHGTREPYLSCDDINSGEHPWLVDPGYGTTYPSRASIMAGVTLTEFEAAIRAAGGRVYRAS